MSSHSPAPARGYSATEDQLTDRLKRIEGPVCGVERMVDEERYCIDVLTQIAAIQAALDKVALGLLDDHAAHWVIGADARERPGEDPGAHGRRRAAAAPRLEASASTSAPQYVS